MDSMNSSQVCINHRKVSCTDCMLSRLCIPIALEGDDIERLDEIVARGKPLKKGQAIYHQGDDFSSLYAIRSGSVKSVSLSDDGVEQVTGFYFPGEVIGLDGIGKQQYSSTTLALEDASVCEIPYYRLSDLSLELPSLQRYCMEIMSNEIVSDHDFFTLLSKGDAEGRVAAFLINISVRNARRQMSGINFYLSMTRTEIGNYLGLTIETVSRTLQKFQTNGLLQVNNKEITLLDVDALKKISII